MEKNISLIVKNIQYYLLQKYTTCWANKHICVKVQLMEKNISLIVKNILLTTKLYNLLRKETPVCVKRRTYMKNVTSLYLEYLNRYILSPSITIWKTVALSQCQTGNKCAQNSAGELISSLSG